MGPNGAASPAGFGMTVSKGLLRAFSGAEDFLRNPYAAIHGRSSTGAFKGVGFC
jgi:hypothetical protein